MAAGSQLLSGQTALRAESAQTGWRKGDAMTTGSAPGPQEPAPDDQGAEANRFFSPQAKQPSSLLFGDLLRAKTVAPDYSRDRMARQSLRRMLGTCAPKTSSHVNLAGAIATAPDLFYALLALDLPRDCPCCHGALPACRACQNAYIQGGSATGTLVACRSVSISHAHHHANWQP